MPQDPKGLDYFKLYFTDAVIDQIWRETHMLNIIYKQMQLPWDSIPLSMNESPQMPMKWKLFFTFALLLEL